MNLWVAENVDTLVVAALVFLFVSFLFSLIFMLCINHVPFIRSLFKVLQRLVFMLVYPFAFVTILVAVATIPIFLIAYSIRFFSLFGFFLNTLIILLLLTIALFIIIGIVLRLPMIATEQQDVIPYEKYGTLRSWGTMTRAYHKRIDWTPVVAKHIAPLLEPIQKPEIRILAPAANCGDEEQDLAKLLSVHINKRFLVTLCDINNMWHIASQDDERVSVSYYTMDAFALPRFLKHPQDVIYDPKGILWFSHKKEEKLIERLRLFYDLLDDQGMVIVDAAVGPWWKIIYNDIRMTYHLPLTFYAEASTYSYIKRFFAPGSVASSLFKLDLVDGLDGPYGMAVLRKVPNRSFVASSS